MEVDMHQETPRQPSESDEDPIEYLIGIFRKYLTSEWTRKKTPYNLKSSLQNARTSEPGSTEQVLLDAGFHVWLAYFLATNGEAHFEGRSAQVAAIASFQQYNISDKKRIAEGVAATTPHPSVQIAIDRILETTNKKRHQNGEQNSNAKRHHLDVPGIPYQEDSHLRAPASPTTVLPPGSTQPTRSLDPPRIQVAEQSVTGASPQRIADIVPSYISSAIRTDQTEKDGKTSWKAAVTMVFPYVGKVDCVMSLAIKKNKLQHVAMVLFDMHIEMETMVQIVHANGTRVIPSPEANIQGAHDQAIANLFGAKIHEAIKASRVYKEEQQQGIRATRCVSMIVPSDPDVGAVINLNLGLKEAFQIQKFICT